MRKEGKKVERGTDTNAYILDEDLIHSAIADNDLQNRLVDQINLEKTMSSAETVAKPLAEQSHPFQVNSLYQFFFREKKINILVFYRLKILNCAVSHLT